ncbi:MAG: heme-binding protein [Actinomycetota bacterium]|nr:heme-binding protein [Actinomycetota bacterium]
MSTLGLGLIDADAMVTAALARGEEIGKAFSIAVVDAGGFPLVVKRVDGARPLTPSIAMSKAYTAAVMQRPANMLKGWAESNPGFFGTLSNHGAWPIVATDGGVTVQKDGEILGGLGVSGGTPAEDQQICDEVLTELGYDLAFAAWGKPAGTDSRG